MGDIILGIFLLILIFGALLLFRLLKRRKQKKVRFIEYISLIIIVGGLIGILTTACNKEYYTRYPTLFWLTILFYAIQTTASILYEKLPRIGLIALAFTFTLQIPIVSSLHGSYSNQTLISIRVGDNELKAIDFEPGSYVSYISFEPDIFNRPARFGINLIPILIIIAYWQDRKNKKEIR